MTREFLKELGLDDETLKKVMAEHGKSLSGLKKKDEDIASLKQQVIDLNNTMTSRDSQISELKKIDADGLKSTIERLKDENKSAKEQYDKVIVDMKMNHAVDSALYKANAKNIKAAKALLDMEKVSFDGENIVGITEQVEQLLNDESVNFMFGGGKPPVVSGVRPAEGKDSNVNSAKSEYERAKLAFEQKPTFENSVALSRAKIESEN